MYKQISDDNTPMFTEIGDRTKVLYAQYKSNNGKWIELEKFYTNMGFEPKEVPMHYFWVKMRNSISEDTEVRILNGMRKQVYGKAAEALEDYLINLEINCDTVSKVARFRVQNSDIPDVIIPDIDYKEGYDNFVKHLQNLSVKGNGFKSFHPVAKTEDDGYLNWFKIKCNNGLVFSVALYN